MFCISNMGKDLFTIGDRLCLKNEGCVYLRSEGYKCACAMKPLLCQTHVKEPVLFIRLAGSFLPYLLWHSNAAASVHQQIA